MLRRTGCCRNPREDRGWSTRAIRAFISLSALIGSLASAQQPHAWTSHDKIAFTYYFYWYNVHDGEHFVDPDGSDALTNHPPDDALGSYSYTDVAWHQQQMQDMVAANIDVALPVYWGDSTSLFWSQLGLRTMVTALQSMAQAGLSFPGIGMFFDTTSLFLQNGHRKLDVTTLRGKTIFYGMIHDFFSIVPQDLWATIDGRPVIVLYGSSYVSAYDQSSLDYLTQQFQNDFGVAPYVIREASWKDVASDAAYGWSAALSGPLVNGDTVSIGPGYDDTAVYGRSPHHIRDRDCGNFYQQGWQTVASSAARLVFVETWNELHEGTEVAATREYSRNYIDLTARGIARWKSNLAYASAPLIWFSPGRDSFQSGLQMLATAGDGVWHVDRVAGRDAAIVDRTSTPPSNHIYIAADRSFLQAVTTPVWVTVEYLDQGKASWRIEYDGASNPYTRGPEVQMQDTGLWKQVTFALPDAYFGGRENAKSDLRINDFNPLGETHYFSRVWIGKSVPPESVLQITPLDDLTLNPGSPIGVPLNAAGSDGTAANLTLERGPGFASLDSTGDVPTLTLVPNISDAHGCSVVITIAAESDMAASLPDATSFRVLVPNVQ